MWLRVAFFTLCAGLVPFAAFAQAQDGGGPSPDVRTEMDAARNSAKTMAFADLSADHRAKVQAVIDSFDATGSTMTVADGAAAIDAILSAPESKAVLAEQQELRDAMRASFSGSGGPADAPDGAGPGGGPPQGMGGRGMGRRRADAGRFFLQVGASQERFREAMRAERGR